MKYLVPRGSGRPFVHGALCVMGLLVRGSFGIVGLMRTARTSSIFPRAPCFPMLLPTGRPAPGGEAVQWYLIHIIVFRVPHGWDAVGSTVT